MRVAIMQPYFLPYIGYFQLIAAADLFIVYDNIKYTKKGWINRNRFLREGKDATFTIPLKSASDSLDVREREIAHEFDRAKLLNQMRAAYRRAPHFAATMQLVERIVEEDERNLFQYVYRSIASVCAHLDIRTPMRISSEAGIDHALKAQDKVLALCAAAGATTYINTIGGTELYAREAFRERGIDLQFIRPRPLEYAQFGDSFVPWLSIVDVLMFNSVDVVRERILPGYELA